MERQLSFAELLTWWWDEYGKKLKSPTTEGVVKKHLYPSLGALPLTDVTPGRIESMLNRKAEALSPRSLNGLRAIIHRVFELASLHDKWHGVNPAKRVKRRKVPKRLPTYLKVDEVPAVLAMLDPSWRPLFATAVYTGLRRGELLALRKSDVDLSEGTIKVQRSLESDTTKGGHADLIPIAEGLRPYLEIALDESKSSLVFPDGEGEQRAPDADLVHRPVTDGCARHRRPLPRQRVTMARTSHLSL